MKKEASKSLKYILETFIKTSIDNCLVDKKTINLKKASYLIKGYEQEIVLLDDELYALQAFTVYAGAAMTFWRHKNFNYANNQLSELVL